MEFAGKSFRVPVESPAASRSELDCESMRTVLDFTLGSDRLGQSFKILVTVLHCVDVSTECAVRSSEMEHRLANLVGHGH